MLDNKIIIYEYICFEKYIIILGFKIKQIFLLFKTNI